MNNRYKSCFDILTSIYSEGKYISQALEPYTTDINSSITTKIVFGVIENDIKLDYIIGQFVKKIKDQGVNVVLKIGACALLTLDNIPKYAIVNDCVNLVKNVGFGSASGLVNAVLKKISSMAYVLPTSKDKNYLSITYSIPQWVVDSLINDYGYTQTEDILSSQRIGTTVRVNRLKTTDEEFAKALQDNNISYKSTPIHNCFEVDYKVLNKNKSLRAQCTPQGLSSMLVIDSIECKFDMLALDCCAAPGGKSIYLAEKLSKGHIDSWDIHPHRVQLIKDYATNIGVNNITAICKDATIFDESLINKYDIVLCDVPCSGLGTIFSKPDVLLNRKREDIASLNKIQYKILSSCAQYVRKGGQLIYSTCSILKSENEQIINQFLANNDSFELSKVQLPVSSISGVGETLLPNISGTDGFYIARLIKCKTH